MRSLWFVAGSAAGVYVMVRGRRAAEALTPEGFGDRLAGYQLGWRLLSEEVRAGMSEKETDLRERMALRLDGPAGRPPALPAARSEGMDPT